MKLQDYLDMNKLCDHLSNHVVNSQHHRYAPLVVYNYTHKAQFDGIWDDVTCKTRGLIVDKSTDEIVSRPFQKFFNYTGSEDIPDTLPEVTDKLDGSLGVLYEYNGTTAIATRGSFESDQAAWASSWYRQNLSHAKWPEGFTPLFEIIYPDNRIVVKYDWEGLALLCLVNKETGEELPHTQLEVLGEYNRCRVVQLLDKPLERILSENEQNREGYVVTWRNAGKPPLKLKIKFTDYVRLHRLLTSISPKEIWRMLRDKEDFTPLFDQTPSHYQEWVNYWKNGLQSEFGRIEQKAQMIWGQCNLPKNGEDAEQRKALAEFFTVGDRKNVSAVLFSMLDGHDYSEQIWRMVRGKTRDEQPFRREE